MARRSVLVLMFLCAAIGLAGYANAGGSADNPKCVGLTGAAFGMCIGAFATECDNPATAKPGCAAIELKFIEITGEKPPWTLPSCPCGTSDEFIKHLEEQGGAVSCTNQVDYFLSIDSLKTVNSVFSFYPKQVVKQTCGFDNTSLIDLTDDQAKSCIIELRSTIENYRLTCGVK